MHTHTHHFKITGVEELPDSEAQITGEITLPFLVECRAEAMKALNKSTSIPGFRTGHIPEDVLVKHVGEMRVLEETAEVALGNQYPHILEEAKLAVIGRPQISITKLAPGIPLEFKIKVYLEPKFDLPDYKKIASEIKEEPAPTAEGEASQEGAREKRRIKIIEALVAETKIAVPKILIESELYKMIGQFQDEVTRAGVKWDEYLAKIKKTEEEIKTEWRPKAEERVKVELILVKIAEVEKLEPTAEEIETEAKHIIEHFPDADPMRARIFAYTHRRNQKVLEFLESEK